ncbi:lasso peptide biosynthesis B2 protein [Caulobacter endophyticus]|uniref:Lasso peptide biosynthesis B2 protein n=1 Tax=Caulobacter endophyticus TaxID=2172652 RepID=A0A2T9KA67_9CAUL|nr:lasso peptide biosynthesis B2 protein [Caulobacter endophyticus]PVM92769.1 lasso peptide biosynthesis B2 protein [Caulobacter endophyticus]
MQLRLGEAVHGVMIDGDAVFLDVQADAYFCLPQVGAILTLDGSSVTTTEPALADSLCAAGMASADPIAPCRPAPPATPSRTARALIVAADEGAARPDWRHWQAMTKAALAASQGRRRAFAALLPDSQGGAAAPDARLLNDLAVFRRLAPWLPLDGLCLNRSHLLRTYLDALGHRVDWMFGVRTWPFRAHCWLQAGDVALDDEAERVAAYHPIMVR